MNQREKCDDLITWNDGGFGLFIRDQSSYTASTEMMQVYILLLTCFCDLQRRQDELNRFEVESSSSSWPSSTSSFNMANIIVGEDHNGGGQKQNQTSGVHREQSFQV